MLIEKIMDGIRYRLTNENIQVGDTVWPIGQGRHVEFGVWLLHELEWSTFDLSAPHIVQGIKGSTIETQRGYSHVGVYFKIILVEEQIRIDEPFSRFPRYEWVPIEIPEITPPPDAVEDKFPYPLGRVARSGAEPIVLRGRMRIESEEQEAGFRLLERLTQGITEEEK